MRRWSREEAGRTLAEVQRRAASDPAFRALALSNPLAAISRVNPKPWPPQVDIHFAEVSAIAHDAGGQVSGVISLPPLTTNELNEEELQKAAGGLDTMIRLLFEE